MVELSVTTVVTELHGSHAVLTQAQNQTRSEDWYAVNGSYTVTEVRRGQQILVSSLARPGLPARRSYTTGRRAYPRSCNCSVTAYIRYGPHYVTQETSNGPDVYKTP
jgi:hypothetical protein